MKIYRIYGSVVLLTDGYIRAKNKKEAKEQYRKIAQENLIVSGELFVDDVSIEGTEEELPKDIKANGFSYDAFYTSGFEKELIEKEVGE